MAAARDTSDEEQLIIGLKAGDQNAFRRAVREHTPAMLSVARFYLDASAAEEVVQDCWVTIVKAIQRFEGRSGLRTWLHRIVANRCKNHLRISNRQLNTDFSEALDPALEDRFKTDGHWRLPPTFKDGASALALMENGALSRCLDQHLAALPEAQRSALMLYEAHQHTSDDVCNILEVSHSNLRVLLHRARQTIFLMVEHFQETGEC